MALAKIALGGVAMCGLSAGTTYSGYSVYKTHFKGAKRKPIPKPKPKKVIEEIHNQQYTDEEYAQMDVWVPTPEDIIFEGLEEDDSQEASTEDGQTNSTGGAGQESSGANNEQAQVPGVGAGAEGSTGSHSPESGAVANPPSARTSSKVTSTIKQAPEGRRGYDTVRGGTGSIKFG